MVREPLVTLAKAVLVMLTVALLVLTYQVLLEEGIHAALSGAFGLAIVFVLGYGAITGRLTAPVVQLLVFLAVLGWSAHSYLVLGGGLLTLVVAGVALVVVLARGRTVLEARR